MRIKLFFSFHTSLEFNWYEIENSKVWIFHSLNSINYYRRAESVSWNLTSSYMAHLCPFNNHNKSYARLNSTGLHVQCVPQKRKPINRVNFSENCNDLSEKAYIFTKFSLSSFFWHQLQDVLAMHEQALTISNGDVKNDLRRMGI